MVSDGDHPVAVIVTHWPFDVLSRLAARFVLVVVVKRHRRRLHSNDARA